MSNDRTTEELARLLAAPFAEGEIKLKPAVVKEGRALALLFVDARCVMNRLDEVFGLGNWQTHYHAVEGGVVCRLRVRIGGEWVEHEDVGSYSEQPDDGDKTKAAFSDSLKRAAVHLGIGRYLYSLPQQWLAYDNQKKRFTEKPRLPSGPRLPAPRPAAPALPAPAPAEQGDAFEADPGEVIGRPELHELAQLMKQAGLVWEQCQRFLRVERRVRPEDLCFRQYQELRAGLEQKAKDRQAQKAW
jgi:hypothetical protein